MKRFILNHWPVLSIIAISLLIFFTNLRPDAWLMGWDHYTPQLNTGLNVERNIFGVWQEGRGLGLLDGLSHTANIIHTLTSGLLSIILPSNLVRYVTHLGLFLLGGLGMYFYARLLKVQKSAACIGALFYQLNLMTIQMFHLPLEVFSVHFAAIPWLLWSTQNYLNKPSKKQLLLFFIVGILSSPQGYVPTVFLAFMGMFVLYLLWQAVVKKIKTKHILVILITLLSTQLFWLLPYVYSFSQNLPVISEAKINRLSNQEILLNNREYGDALSIFTYKGVYLSFLEATEQERPNKLVMQDWVEYSNTNQYLIASLLFTFITLTGGIYCIKKHKLALFFVFMWLSLFAVLAATTQGISYFTHLLDTYFPLFLQAYRFSFTKFSLLYVFCTSILLMYGVEWLQNMLRSTFQKKMSLFLLFSALLLCSVPVFSGKLFYQKIQVSIPKEYFELQTFFNQQSSDERVLFLPQSEVWGWTYNNWGFVGSGWVWQLLRQPILDGAFYPWLAENENAYEQLERALSTNNSSQLKQTLDKYTVKWIIIDDTLIHTPQKASDIKKILELQPEISLQKSYGFLHVYAVASPTVQRNNLLETPQLTVVTSPKIYSSRDPVYETVGAYLQSNQFDNSESIFPFSQVWSNRSLSNSIKYQTTNDVIQIKSNVPSSERAANKYQLSLPVTTEPFALISATLKRESNVISLSLNYPIEIREGDSAVFSPAILESNFEYLEKDRTYMVEIGQDRFFLHPDEIEAREFIFSPTNQDLSVALYMLENNGDGSYAADLIDSKKITSDEVWSNYFSIEKTKYLITDISKLSAFTQAKPISIDLETSAATLNCDPMDRGSFSRTYSSIDDVKKVVYTAQNKATLCDHYAFPQASNDISYLLQMNGGSIQGVPLQFYVLNWISDSIVLQDSLPNTSFESYFSLLSEPAITNGGISVNFKTKSFTQQRSVSKLSKLELYPIPLEKIGTIQILNQKPTLNTITADSQKIFPELYNVNIATNNKSNVLVFNQSAQPAWIAFPNNRPWQLLDHRVYNGWANAWIVPAGTTAVTILFWPQLLSFFGYGVLIVIFFWLSITALRQPTQSVTGTTKYSGGYVGSAPTSTLNTSLATHFKKLKKRLLGTA